MAATTSVHCVKASSFQSIFGHPAPSHDGTGPANWAWHPAPTGVSVAGPLWLRHRCLVSSFTGRALQRPTALSKVAQRGRALHCVAASAEAVAGGTGAAPLSTEQAGQEDSSLAVDLVDVEADYEENERGVDVNEAGGEGATEALLAAELELVNRASSTRASSKDVPSEVELSGWFKQGYEEDEAEGQDDATAYDRPSHAQEGEGQDDLPLLYVALKQRWWTQRADGRVVVVGLAHFWSNAGSRLLEGSLWRSVYSAVPSD